MSFKLRDYQERIINDVLSHLDNNLRCCVSLATGGGKTVIFSNLVPKLEGRTLICVHREELVNQTSNTLTMDHDLITSKVKTQPLKKVCVSMVQTLWSRIKSNKVDVNDYDNIIIDECHRGEFMKVLDFFKGKVIGFTATPNYEKTVYFFKCLKCGNESEVAGKCCKNKLKKYKRNVPLSKFYNTLIEGVQINELIEQGYLVKDENYVLEVDTSILVYNESLGDYTEESIALVFGSKEAIKNTVDTYKELAFGQKTILFNPNTLVNKKLYEAMSDEGLNVKMYDSVNSIESRHELVEWFKNTPDAILLNVQVFTTGFDCTDVEVVFLNKKTQSVNLYLQMVGRGGRITDKILKPSFKVIDMGNNNEMFNAWSSSRVWEDYFYHTEEKAVGPPQPASTRICHACESIVSANSLICEVCDEERIYTHGGVVGLPMLNGKPVIPTPEKIISYCEENNLDALQARKIVYDYAGRMFINTKPDVFFKAKQSGDLYNRALQRFTPYYFAIQNSKLEGNKVRRRQSFINEIIKNIERRYTTS